MKAVRCCISCILPCGALDVIRIVHSNGHVEEISRPIKASEILKLHPKHVLKKPSSPSSSSSSADEDGPKIVAVDPESELKRGKIYFLMPAPPPPKKKKKPAERMSSAKKKTAKKVEDNQPRERSNGGVVMMSSCVDNLVACDQYLSDIMTENKVSSRERRQGRVGIFRPRLESISEMPLIEL